MGNGFADVDPFEQEEPITTRLHNILNNYPEGAQILKEQIQNADDAGARRISFILDKRTHAVQNLRDAPKLARFQGTSDTDYLRPSVQY